MATFGIDLGTTYSCVAHIDDTGRPAIVKNRPGDDTTPSVVYFESPDNVVVGKEAKAVAKIHPDQVVSLIKRQMGRPFEITVHGQTHTPESISALILRELADAATESLGEPVRDVVITVPAYFGVAERDATRKAGEIAGLNVLSMVDEPVAAALHYDAINTGGTKTLFVYDLGGGTFDTTVIRVSPDEIQVVCTDGDHHLGGADWDDRLAEYLLERFLAEHPGSEAADDEEFLQGLAAGAEDIKKQLSRMQSRRFNARFGGDTAQIEVSREKFEELTSDLLERTVTITRRTLETAAGRGVTDFDDVLLVGGSSRMPAVSAALESLGLTPRMHDPDLAVAKGAARYALIESVKVHLPASGGEAPAEVVDEVAERLNIPAEKVRALAGKRVATVVPRAFGVKVVDLSGGREHFTVTHVLRANTPLPAETEPHRFGTAYPNQVEVAVEIWEQSGAVESDAVEDNEHIAEGLISGLPPLPVGSPIDISFQMAADGLLRVHAVELKTGKDLDIEVQIRGGLTDEQVSAARNAVARYHVSA
ncbi:molecular chaperone Hsp70 [Actinoplanes sp. SE50]|uniref:Hsp70 family protein n=1 Tax=unclassified Actinoplanes TaxID=2626549 RepID=UPI00023EDCC3|nr:MULTISPECIES: Hsp70 family protein [unclassified Actinoplanes]AEV89081.1 heat shock protein 70 [Actinoplanes sp. SE50/110]ATO87487.1 molecular chaperone Hsp70 [Actinoplanes sp. SE50]SLM04905.1 molecular chaperone Hsp70 [Actinoplanes sp. SE50/110]